MYTLHLGNSMSVLPTLPANSIDSIVCDPPYELNFMSKSWDASGIAYSVKLWQEALRVLKPGGHLLAFSGSRTYHRMTCAIEDAGFEIRDSMMWVYSSGFPKSLDVSKAIDKAAGVAFGSKPASGVGFMNEEGEGGYNTTKNQLYRTGESTPAAKQWQGWGTALKPAHEPICVARKPLTKGLTVAANVLAHGTGALNIDGCRVAGESTKRTNTAANSYMSGEIGVMQQIGEAYETGSDLGRWPANLIHDGLSEEWARFFYCAKTSKKDRNEGLDDFPTGQGGVGETRPSGGFNERMGKGTVEPRANTHPTVKPTDLMRYLCRLVTPPGGTVLDPFMGSGSTGKAAMLEEFRFIGIEMDETYHTIAKARIEAACMTLFADMI